MNEFGRTKIAILGNGDITLPASHLHETYDYIIAADGGANYAAQNGIDLDAIVGDGDSIFNETKEYFDDIPQVYSTDQDTTDLAKAITYAQTLAERIEIDLIGFSSAERLDHTQAAIFCIMRYPHIIRSVITPTQRVFYTNSEIVLIKPNALVYTLSLLPITKTATVNLQGLQWSGENIVINSEGSGMSNLMIEERVVIKVEDGAVLIYMKYEKKVSN